MVLVQGTADADDRDLDANRDRYWEESIAKLPATKSMHPPKFLRGLLSWYYTRIYVHVRPERVYVWPERRRHRRARAARLTHGGGAVGPRRGARRGARAAAGRSPVWDGRMDELGDRYTSGVVSIVSPDGFPFSVRVPIGVDRSERLVRLGDRAPSASRSHPGPACLAVHDHASGIQVAAELPGPGRPGRARRRVGAGPAQARRRVRAAARLDALAVPAELLEDAPLPKDREARAREEADCFPQIAGSCQPGGLTNRQLSLLIECRDAIPSATKSGS